MSEQELRNAIETIRSELAQARGLSESNQASLRRLVSELESRLARGGPPPESDTLPNEIANRVRELEASHPRLSTTLGQVVDWLALHNL